MIRYVITTLLAYLWTSPAFALYHGQSAPLWDHLVEVNVQWEKQVSDPHPYQELIQFATDRDRIQAHLHLVTDLLKNRPTEHLNAEQIQRRQHHLGVLQAYADAGKFPINDGHPYRIPYFIDGQGTACAVGHLLIEDGLGDFVRVIQAEMNNAYLLDMPYEELPVWAAHNGFTLGELAWIQPGYGYPWECPSWSALDNGNLIPNDEVNFIIEDPNAQRLIMCGKFTAFGTTPVNGVAAFDGFSAVPLGMGINGRVYAGTWFNNLLYLGGTFNNGTANLAVWDGNSWMYEQVYTGTIYAITPFGNGLVIGGDLTHSGGAIVQHILQGNTGNWITVGQGFDAPVRALEVHNGQLYAGGNFLNSGATATQHVAVWDSTGWSPWGNGLDSHVLALKSVGGDLYAGGAIFDSTFARRFGLARMIGAGWENMLDSSLIFTVTGPMEINQLYDHQGKLMTGGTFYISMSPDYYGNHISNYDANTKQLLGIGMTDYPILSFAHLKGKLVIAGDFTYAAPNNIDHAAIKGQITALDPHDASVADLVTVPNPAVHQFKVQYQAQAGQDVNAVELWNMAGQQLKIDWQTHAETVLLQRGDLPAGTYFVRLKHGDQVLGASQVVFQ